MSYTKDSNRAGKRGGTSGQGGYSAAKGGRKNQGQGRADSRGYGQGRAGNYTQGRPGTRGERANGEGRAAGGYGESRSFRGNAYGAPQGRAYRGEKPYAPAAGQARRGGEKPYPPKGRDAYDPYVQRGAPPLPREKKLRSQPKPVKPYEKPAGVEAPREEDATLLVGRNAVWEALKAGRAMERLYVAQGVDETALQGILGVAYREKVKVERVPRTRVTELAGTDKHQGVVAHLSVMEYTPLDKLVEDAFAATDSPVFVLLDEVQDPHNLGAIIRTADCAGANGIIILEHRAVGLTATVSKVSAGALAHMPVAKATNLVRVMETLQQRGVEMVGADMGGVCCYDCDFTAGPLGLVIGNEGVGLRRLVREQCDVLAGIPIHGHVDSLNASVAAAVLMFEAVRQRKFAK